MEFYIFASFLLICSFNPAPIQALCGQRPAGSRIVGGHTAVPHSWPWQLSLRNRGTHTCGASLITSTWAVTAAHCVGKSLDPAIYSIMAGGHHRANDDGRGTIFGVSEVIRHKGFGIPHLRDDIALLRLSTPIPLSSKVNTICLPQSGERVRPGTMCYISGWGFDSGEVTSRPAYLQQSQVPIISHKQCSNKNGWVVHERSMVCAGGAGSSICSGDSGGPLVCEERGAWVLRGASSWVDSGNLDKCPVNKPSVFARVSSYVQWIQDKTATQRPLTQAPSISTTQSLETPPPTRPSVTKPPTGQCMDNSNNCKTFYKLCSWHSRIRKLCKKTCNLCKTREQNTN